MSTDCSQTGSALFKALGVGKAPVEVVARCERYGTADNASTGSVWLVWHWTLDVSRSGALQFAHLRRPQLSAPNPCTAQHAPLTCTNRYVTLTAY